MSQSIKGLRVDAKAIGEGIYQMICDREEEALVAFGMLPSWAMEMLEKQLTDKVLEESAKQVECTVDELMPYVDKKKVKSIVDEILHAISVEIYGAASRAGKMVC